MICGPELEKYRGTKIEFHLHHEEVLATQIKMKQYVQSLVEVILSAFGNPFEDDCLEFLFFLIHEIVQTDQSLTLSAHAREGYSS